MGAEHGVVHELRIRFAGYVDDCLLDDRDSTAGVANLAAGNEVHADRLGVRRLLAVENLRQRRYRLAHGVSGESVDRESGGVTEEAAQRDLLRSGEFVVRHLPALQIVVDVGVERQLAVFDQVKRAGGLNGLADRARLKQRLRCDRRRGSGFGDAVALCPRRLEVVDYGHGQSRDIQGLHQLLQIELQRRLASAHGYRDQVGFHPLNVLVIGRRALLPQRGTGNQTRSNHNHRCRNDGA